MDVDEDTHKVRVGREVVERVVEVDGDSEEASTTEANRVAFLFDRYEALANPLAV